MYADVVRGFHNSRFLRSVRGAWDRVVRRGNRPANLVKAVNGALKGLAVVALVGAGFGVMAGLLYLLSSGHPLLAVLLVTLAACALGALLEVLYG